LVVALALQTSFLIATNTMQAISAKLESFAITVSAALVLSRLN